MSLAPGFNVITGETGAGKSLVIDAIEALLDGKLEEESIRFGADSARIEAVFFVSRNPIWGQVRALLEEKGVSVEEDDLVTTCEFRRQGRGVLRINGGAVTRNLLREVGSFLVDIHGQSEHLSLFNKKNHLNYLDAYAHCEGQKMEFGEQVSNLLSLQGDLDKLTREANERTHRQEILQYQIEEISRAKLKGGEEENLEQRRRVISSCEKIKARAYEVHQALNGDEGAGPAAFSFLNRSIHSMEELVSMDPSLKPQLEGIEGAVAGLEEIARDIRSYEEGLEYDPRELEEIESRLELLHTLKKKYGGSVAGIIEYQNKAEAELAHLESAGADESKLTANIAGLKRAMGKQAADLSTARLKAASKFEHDVESELAEMNMSQVRFKVEIKQADDPGGIPLGDRLVSFSKDGTDEVEFMVSTNPGEPIKPLVSIASTGEVSRFTLALKVALAEADSIPVLIFDEIDIGIGGRSGDIIGKKLWTLARNHQVICVTHLPQIAVFADAHFTVRKETSKDRTTSFISALNEEERIPELAAMMGGNRSETTLRSVSEMTQISKSWKKSKS
jgi:DNA repair protein RecN (Recombination protein N)